MLLSGLMGALEAASQTAATNVPVGEPELVLGVLQGPKERYARIGVNALAPCSAA